MTNEKKLGKKLPKTIDEMKSLKGLLPICSSCKKIRDEHQPRHPVENYIRDRFKAEFSREICPDCVKKSYPQ